MFQIVENKEDAPQYYLSGLRVIIVFVSVWLFVLQMDL